MRTVAACFALLAVLALPATSHADWPVTGLLLASNARQFSDVHILPQGPGRFVATFTRADDMTLSYQTSSALYGGFDATTGSGWGKFGMTPYPDGADGFFVYGEDYGTPGGSYGLSHVTAGSPNPEWPAASVAITDFRCAAPDSAGGAYVVAGSPECLFRYTPQGVIAPGWPAGGVFLSSAAQFAASSPLLVDASGRAVVIFLEAVNTLRVVRVLPDGTLDPAWTSVALPELRSPTTFRLLADGDGFCAVWRDTSTYMARLGSDGALRAGWPVKAIASDATTLESNHLVTFTDGSGGFFVFCSSPDQGGHLPAPVFATHVLANGTVAPGWSLPGAAVSIPGTGPISTTSYIAGPDSLGGAFFGWGGKLTRLAGDHAVASGWSASGDVITADHLSVFTDEAVVGDGTGAALAVVTAFVGPYQSLCMVRFVPAGLAGVTPAAPRATLGVEMLGANPAAGARRFALALAGSAPAAFEILDVTGRVVSREFVATGGAATREYTWAPAAARPGVYFARITQRGVSRTARFVVLE